MAVIYFMAVIEEKIHYIKCKGFKDLSYVLVICSIFGVCEILMILLSF